MKKLEEVAAICLGFEGNVEHISDNLTELYRIREIKYPKYFKMNLL